MCSSATLSLQRQASLLVRYLAAVTFKDDGMPAAADLPEGFLRNQVIRPLEIEADRLLTLRDPPTADDLRASGVCLVTSLGMARERGLDVAAIRIEAMARDMRAEMMRQDGQWAPTQIYAIFENLLAAVAEKYAASCRYYVDAPTVSLVLRDAHEGQRLDPSGSLAIGGSCRLRGVTAAAADIFLVIRDGGFDWPSACALPYIFVHELLCHAFQGLADGAAEGGSGTERHATDATCAWSEGWMDTLALWLTEEWLEGAGLPTWIAEARMRVRAGCTLLHASRFAHAPELRPGATRRRVSARAAVDMLQAAFAHLGTTEARRRIFGFSLSLNFARIPQNSRNKLNDLIATGLEISVDRFEILAAMTEFETSGDWCRLAARLTEIVLPET